MHTNLIHRLASAGSLCALLCLSLVTAACSSGGGRRGGTSGSDASGTDGNVTDATSDSAGPDSLGPDAVGGCSNACLVDTVRCAGDGSQQCVLGGDGCTSWSEVTSCDSGTTCSNGVCSSECQDECAAGETRCDPGGVLTCGQHDSDSCLDLGPPAACPEGAVCADGSCTTTCTDSCDAAGATVCTDGGVAECQTNPAGCLELGLPLPCPAGESCSSGTCSAGCSDECTPGESICSGDGRRNCGQYDADPCLDLGPVTPCPGTDDPCAKATCSAGECTTQAGNDGASCDDDDGCTTGDSCSGGACSGTPVDCGDEICAGGECVCPNEAQWNGSVWVATVDLPAVDVTIQLRLNGQPAPTDRPTSDQGTISIQTGGQWIALATYGALNSTSVTVRMIPGTYELQYEAGNYWFNNGSNLLPANRQTIFGALVIPPNGGTVVVDLPVAPTTFELKMNGAPAPLQRPENDRGFVSIGHVFAPSAEEASDPIGFNNGSWNNATWMPLGTYGDLDATSFDVPMIPGTYSARYEAWNYYFYNGDNQLPVNDITFFDDITIEPGGGVVVVDLPVVTVDMSLQLNGEPAPMETVSHDRGTIAIRSSGGAWLNLVDYGDLGVTTFSLPLVPGDYQARYWATSYWSNTGENLLPANDATIFQTQTIGTTKSSWAIDLPAVQTTLSLKLNGAPAPTTLTEGDRGRVGIRHQQGDWMTLAEYGDLDGTTFPLRLIPGDYQVQYGRGNYYFANGQNQLPLNDLATVGNTNVPPQGGTVSIDVPAVDVTIQPLLNGAPAPTALSQSDQGVVYLEHVGDDGVPSGFEFPLGTWGDLSPLPKLRLVPGTYRIHYDAGNYYFYSDSNQLPLNELVVVGTIEVPTTGGTVPVNVPAVDAQLLLQVNGAPAPKANSQNDQGTVAIRHRDGQFWDDLVIYGDLGTGSNATSPMMRLVPGTYDVRYDRGNYYSGTLHQLPANSQTTFTCFRIDP